MAFECEGKKYMLLFLISYFLLTVVHGYCIKNNCPSTYCDGIVVKCDPPKPCIDKYERVLVVPETCNCCPSCYKTIGKHFYFKVFYLDVN